MRPLIALIVSGAAGARAAPRRLAWVLWLILGTALAWLLLQSGASPWTGTAAPAASPTLVLRDAEFIVADSQTVPPDDARWQKAKLPHRVAKPDHADLIAYWYKVAVRLPPTGPLSGTQQPLWLYLPRLDGGGTVFVNGELVNTMPSANQQTHARLLYPHLLLLPPFALQAGVNQIALHFSSREPRTSVGALEIGPERAVRPRFEQRLFIETTAAEISAAVCMMAAVGLLAFWLRRPQEHLYGLFALSLLFWGVRTLVIRWSVIPIAYLLHWRLVYYIAHAGFAVSILIFVLHFSQRYKPRFERCLIAYAAGGCLLFAIVGMRMRGVMDSYWQMPFFMCAVYCLAHLVIFASRQRVRSSLAMGVAMLLALALSMHDFAVQEGWFGLSDIYLLHLGIPVFLLVMAGMLLERFVDSLHRAESANERLALRVRERERELALSYERLSHLERVHGATEERQRIMQDMHDGVGAQLLGAMAIVDGGNASRTDTMALLQNCLDDMRLAIDSPAPDDPDLLPALGNFRFRMQARFAAAGITLVWRNHAMPDSLEFGSHAGLQVLRILQEALANILQDVQAASVMVDLHFTARHLMVRIADDGGGLDHVGQRDRGGLASMQHRAERIGACLTIEQRESGSALTLDIPVVSPVSGQPVLLVRQA